MRLRRVIWNPWQSNGKLKNMKNQSFEVLCHKQNPEWKEEKQREICHEAFLMTVMLSTFGALPKVHFLHFIYHFKAQEVNNLMLQMVHNSELKRRSYSHWKTITPSWRRILHGCEISLWLRNFAAILHACKILLKLPDICHRLS